LDAVRAPRREASSAPRAEGCGTFKKNFPENIVIAIPYHALPFS